MTTAEQAATASLFAGLEDDREGASQYLSIFIDEAQSTLDELIEALLALETGGGKKQVEQLFIAAHRMKGSAASIGLNRIAKLSHLMEDLLQALVDKGCVPTPQITDALLSCTDGLRQSVNALQSGEILDDRFPALAEELLAASASDETAAASASATPTAAPLLASPESAAEAPSVSAAEISDDLRGRLADVILAEQRDDVLIGQIVFEANLPLVGLKAQLLCQQAGERGRNSPPESAAGRAWRLWRRSPRSSSPSSPTRARRPCSACCRWRASRAWPSSRWNGVRRRPRRQPKPDPPSPAPNPPRRCESTSNGSTS